MADKYEDLTDAISSESGVTSGDAWSVLCWLDRNPDQVPGRTITASRKREVAQRLEFDPRYSFDEMVHDFGLVSVPDPEPTNAEKLEALLREAEAAPMSVTNRARWMDAQGVRAPGGDE